MDKLTHEQILAKWDAMTPRERDAWVAEKVMGHEVGFNQPNKDYVYTVWKNEEKTINSYEFVPHYSTDMCAVLEVVSSFKTLSQMAVYVGRLKEVIIHEKGSVSEFDLIHATAEQRCKAALLAVMADG